jgi:phosphomannomutase
MVKKRCEFSDLSKLRSALDFIEANSPHGIADKLDGLKWTQETSWVQVRASNTEPILRIFAEARSASEANSLAESILKLIDKQS